MDRNFVIAVVTGLLLVPLAWIGIVLGVKVYEGHANIPVMLIWGVVFVVDVVIAFYSVLHLRSARRVGGTGR
jgi:hypothetical protein